MISNRRHTQRTTHSTLHCVACTTGSIYRATRAAGPGAAPMALELNLNSPSGPKSKVQGEDAAQRFALKSGFVYALSGFRVHGVPRASRNVGREADRQRTSDADDGPPEAAARTITRSCQHGAHGRLLGAEGTRARAGRLSRGQWRRETCKGAGARLSRGRDRCRRLIGMCRPAACELRRGLARYSWRNATIGHQR